MSDHPFLFLQREIAINQKLMSRDQPMEQDELVRSLQQLKVSADSLPQMFAKGFNFNTVVGQQANTYEFKLN